METQCLAPAEIITSRAEEIILLAFCGREVRLRICCVGGREGQEVERDGGREKRRESE